ncbi:hypothetical protein FGO68_gene227 [Halteria grandinella]|uniref:Uncharacterized protein n=1 Tax=Halteria grandinella TaxID=5974 RepID=A0A8J8T8Y1_HALGN|nr:hypothetical protein FGO68_gene227 [Halteria grandinella]
MPLTVSQIQMMTLLTVRAMMKDMMAASKRIRTRRSSKDSLIFSQRDSSSSFSSWLWPYFSSLFFASSEVRPFARSVCKSATTFLISFL